MLEYFPTNYVWNLSTNIALLMGGNIGEVDTICRKLVEVSKAEGDDAGNSRVLRSVVRTSRSIGGTRAGRLSEGTPLECRR